MSLTYLPMKWEGKCAPWDAQSRKTNQGIPGFQWPNGQTALFAGIVLTLVNLLCYIVDSRTAMASVRSCVALARVTCLRSALRRPSDRGRVALEQFERGLRDDQS